MSDPLSTSPMPDPLCGVSAPTPLSGWILTYTGRRFWPLAPRVEDVAIEDIAHALSLICRFTGHVRTFYSVAQHCVLASKLVHPKYALEALLHDASETYLCDVPRPVKQDGRMVFYRQAEIALDDVIRQRFALNCDQMGGVKAADNQLLLTERRDLMPAGHWFIDESQCLPQTIVPWSSRTAEQSFLRRYEELKRC